MSSFAFLPITPLPNVASRQGKIICSPSMTAAAAPKTKVGILGASGYTGVELLRLLAQHPLAEVSVLTAERSAGKTIGDVYPQFSYGTFGSSLPALVRNDDIADWAEATNLVFCCLPHATTQEIISSLPLSDGVRVVDLSADFRLRDVDVYAEWYGGKHLAPELQKEAVYGLSELFRDDIRDARLVANPGCYPTTAQLPLIPLLQERLILPGDIIIDAKSGATGAGRSPQIGTLFCEVSDGISAYGVASHRHMPEIEQGLTEAYGGDEPVRVTFTPHLMPMSRGILETIYAKAAPGANADTMRKCLADRYDGEPFVHVLGKGAAPPQTRHVRGSNNCVIQVIDDKIPGRVIIISALDNVVKGASGQAIQNMNIMMGYPETMGLENQPTFP